MTSHLFSPIRLRSLELANRIVVSPMCQYSAIDGRATNWHTIHLGQLALSGAGLLVVEATTVEPIGRITPGCLGLYDDASEEALGWAIDAVREVSPMPIAIQIGHAGRKASSGRPWEGGQLIRAGAGGWQPVGPSAIPHLETEPAPRELDADDLKALLARFVDTVERANRLGFDAIEMHAAHGYLLHQFLSPLSNQRNDEYGGSAENRMRYPLEVFAAMRAAWPAHKPMGIRVSCTDWVEGGWDVADTVEFARRAQAIGADWIDASSGGVSPRQRIALGPGYQAPFAEAIRREVKIPVIAVGLITEPRQAEEIVASGKADMVALGRGLLYDPRWPWHAAAELGAIVEAPRQYWRSQPPAQKTLFGKTSFGAR
jgi:2,4-dienoyl-CoA reductase-like NADH-dependent reductase (Old Yellow Enzyme family)